jgi:quercetin dioxygenase-like cupin family protein
MDAFEIPQILRDREHPEQLYSEFLRVPSLSAGVYVLPAGGLDPQGPHAEDEVYCVISGHGAVQVAHEHRAVGPGSVVYVPAGIDHRFHTISEDLTILVIFAPAEYSLSPDEP